MKLRRLILVILLLLSLIESKDFSSITLNQFANIVSSTSKFNVVISDTVDKDFSIFLPNFDFFNRKKSLTLLQNILELNNLSYKIVDNVVIIYDKSKIKKPNEEKNDYIIKFKNLTDDEIKGYFSSLYPDLKYTILRGRVFLHTTFKNFMTINKQFMFLDSSFLTKKINVTVVSTSDRLNKDLGADFKFLSFNANSYISLLTSRVDSPVTLTSKTQFYTFLNYLNEKNYSDIISNPQITLSDSKDSLLESTTNIPFLQKTTSVSENQTTTENSYDYKDVGLKIYFTNVSISDNSVNFDLEIFIQSILDSSLTPKVSNKHIKTHCTLTDESVFFLGGLNETTVLDSVTNLPVLEYVPIINKITEHKVKTKEKLTFSIILTLGDDDDE